MKSDKVKMRNTDGYLDREIEIERVRGKSLIEKINISSNVGSTLHSERSLIT